MRGAAPPAIGSREPACLDRDGMRPLRIVPRAAHVRDVTSHEHVLRRAWLWCGRAARALSRPFSREPNCPRLYEPMGSSRAHVPRAVSAVRNAPGPRAAGHVAVLRRRAHHARRRGRPRHSSSRQSRALLGRARQLAIALCCVSRAKIAGGIVRVTGRISPRPELAMRLWCPGRPSRPAVPRSPRGQAEPGPNVTRASGAPLATR